MRNKLAAFLAHHPATAYVIAYSGGLDSHALLHACAALRAEHALHLRAIHIDHGLQSVSAHWAEHCRRVCDDLAIPFTCVSLQLQIPAGASLEAVAREARYAVFREHLHAGEMLLTAHHQDDQAETLLLHLLRGSGVDGLAAMPAVRALGQGSLGRPLLTTTRAELSTYAQAHALHFITDPSNTDTRFDRNYLRQQVMPLLTARWGSASKTLARAAQWQAESRALLEVLVREKLPALHGSRANTLSIQRLLALDAALQKAVLREWVTQVGFVKPPAQQLQQLLSSVLLAKPDAAPCVRWQGCEVRRYRDDLYALSPLMPLNTTQVWEWCDLHQPLYLEVLQQTLQPELLQAWRSHCQGQTVTVRLRQGGESVYLPQRGGKHSLKALLQERGIPPWERERLPLVYMGARLLGIPDVIWTEPTT